MEKKHKLIYWILTILMFVPGVIGGVVEVFTDGPESIVKIMLFLGYALFNEDLRIRKNIGRGRNIVWKISEIKGMGLCRICV